MCKSCYENCASKVDTSRIVQLLGTYRYNAGKMKLPYRMVFERILPNKGLMVLETRLMSTAQDLGLEKNLDSGVVIKLFPEAGAVPKLMPKLPKKRAKKMLPEVNKAVLGKRGKVVYFLGCAVDLAYSQWLVNSTVTKF